jgi:hypothetical protein
MDSDVTNKVGYTNHLQRFVVEIESICLKNTSVWKLRLPLVQSSKS